MCSCHVFVSPLQSPKHGIWSQQIRVRVPTLLKVDVILSKITSFFLALFSSTVTFRQANYYCPPSLLPRGLQRPSRVNVCESVRVSAHVSYYSYYYTV